MFPQPTITVPTRFNLGSFAALLCLVELSRPANILDRWTVTDLLRYSLENSAVALLR
jgi:hypothetical protein